MHAGASELMEQSLTHRGTEVCRSIFSSEPVTSFPGDQGVTGMRSQDAVFDDSTTWATAIRCGRCDRSGRNPHFCRRSARSSLNQKCTTRSVLGASRLRPASSRDHSLHEPGTAMNTRSAMPSMLMTSRLWQAVTPLPQ